MAFYQLEKRSGSEYDRAVEREILRMRGEFILDFMKAGRGSEEDAIKAWNQLWKAKTNIAELEERMRSKIVKWNLLKKNYEAMLKAQGHPKSVIEKTMEARKRDWERAQQRVRGRLNRVNLETDEEFCKRILNRKTRKEALQYYLKDSANKQHWLVEAVKILFEKL